MSENHFHTSPPSEDFGTIPQGAETFRSVPKDAERKENHTLTVREVVRMFEAAGVARTERSITNWCLPNRTGIARLDSYFDPNERKYYLTPQSVELAIAEEQAKAAKLNQTAEAFGNVPKEPEIPKATETPKADESRVKELERENLDLKITNRAKDQVIEHLQKERHEIFEQAISANRKVGELEVKLLSLESSK